MTTRCCPEMGRRLTRLDIKLSMGQFWIYGRPELVDDGGGYFDDMTEGIKISFCPFCGAALDEVEAERGAMFDGMRRCPRCEADLETSIYDEDVKFCSARCGFKIHRGEAIDV